MLEFRYTWKRRNTNSSEQDVKMISDTINNNIGGQVMKVTDGNTLEITQAVDQQEENRDM